MYNFEFDFNRHLILNGKKIFEEYWEKVCAPAIELAVATHSTTIFAVYEIDHSAAMRAVYSLLPRGTVPGAKVSCFRDVHEYMDARKELTEHFMEVMKESIGYYDVRLYAAAAAADKTLSEAINKIRRDIKNTFYARARILVENLYHKH